MEILDCRCMKHTKRMVRVMDSTRSLCVTSLFGGDLLWPLCTIMEVRLLHRFPVIGGYVPHPACQEIGFLAPPDNFPASIFLGQEA